MKLLQVKFIGFFLLGLGLTMAVALWGSKQLLQSIEMQMGTGFSKKQVLYDKERSMRPVLQELYLARKLATSPEVQDWAKNVDSPGIKSKGLKRLETFRLESEDHSYFIALSSSKALYFNNDQLEISSEPRYFLDPTKQKDRWFFNTLKQQNTCRLNVGSNEDLKVQKVWINCVITVEGIPLGVVGTGFELTQFINQVINDSEQGISNLFIASNGAIQAHRDHEMIDFDSITKSAGAQKSLFHLIHDEEKQAALRGVLFRLKQHPGEAETLVLNIQGRLYLVGVAYIPEIDWYNVSLLEVDRWGDRDFVWPLVLVLFVVIVLLFGLSYGMFKWLISDRLSRLGEQVAQVSHGDFDIPRPASNGDEIGRLADNVTEMARSIESRIRELEQVVNERTEELKEANHTKDKFFSIISHDLRGPTGSLSIILNEVVKVPSDIDEALLEGLQRTTLNLYNLSSQLFEWARSQQGRIEVCPKDFPLKNTVVEMMDLLSGQAEQKGVALVDNVDPEVYVQADPAMISVVVRNLLSNALKYTPQGGEVRVEASRQKDKVEVRVIDNGIGMETSVRKKLFILGEKVTSQLGTHKEEGSGLGLILCAEFVRQNQGEIWVDSLEGTGSTFGFTLMLGKPIPQVIESAPLSFEDLRVLLVERHPLHQHSSTNCLKKLGLSCQVASESSQAVELAAAQGFDLILMDVELGGIDGVQVAQQIRKDTEKPPVIFALSSYTEPELKDQYPQAEFSAYLEKPLDPDQLSIALYRSLQGLGAP